MYLGFIRLPYWLEMPDLIGRHYIQHLDDTSPRTITGADTDQLAGT